MFLHARSARRPAFHLSAASLSPIFRERYLSALAKVQAARENHLSIKAADRKETLICGLRELSTTTTGTAGIISTSSGELSPSSNVICAIEADLSAFFGETSTLPAEVDSLPSTPTSHSETESAAKYLTYPPPSRTYAAPKKLGREMNGGEEHFEPFDSIRARPAQPAPVSSVKDFEPELGIRVDIPTETAVKPSIPSSFKDALPIDKDTDSEFTIIEHNVDAPSTPAVLVQGADVEPDDVDVFVLIPREAGDALSEQPTGNANDGGDDWVNVNA